MTGFFRILLDRPGPLVEPPLKVLVEYGERVSRGDLPGLEERLVSLLREEVRFSPQIELVQAGTIPREAMKTSFIEIKGAEE